MLLPYLKCRKNKKCKNPAVAKKSMSLSQSALSNSNLDLLKSKKLVDY